MESYYEEYDGKAFSNRYSIISSLGEGTFGEVKKAIDNDCLEHAGSLIKRFVAIKYVRLMSKKNGLPKAIFREIESLKQLSDCEYIVKLEKVFATDTNICLVMEYIENDLAKVIEQANKANMSIPREQLKLFYLMMCKAVGYCHSLHVIHRDIKPSNFLITNTGTLKLADFGLARIYDPLYSQDNLSHQVATRQYRSPELLFASRNYTHTSDIWSMAVIFVELILLKTLFPSHNDLDQMYKVFQIMGTPTPERWPGVDTLPDYSKVSFPDLQPVELRHIIPHAHHEDIQFINNFLQLDPSKRMNATEALLLPYFTSELPRPVNSSSSFFYLSELVSNISVNSVLSGQKTNLPASLDEFLGCL